MRTFFILAVSLLLPSIVQAQLTGTAASGHPVRIYYAYATNPDCSSQGQPVIKLAQAPQHGKVTISRGGVFPNFPASNIRNACNRRRVSGLEVYYVSQRGYTGTDTAAFEVIFPDGQLRQLTVFINVR